MDPESPTITVRESAEMRWVAGVCVALHAGGGLLLGELFWDALMFDAPPDIVIAVYLFFAMFVSIDLPLVHQVTQSMMLDRRTIRYRHLLAFEPTEWPLGDLSAVRRLDDGDDADGTSTIEFVFADETVVSFSDAVVNLEAFVRAVEERGGGSIELVDET